MMWTDSKDFAFTIFDDADNQDLTNGPPVYDFLQSKGFKITKSVWPLVGTQHPYGDMEDDSYHRWAGRTCNDSDYLEWVHRLQSEGLEIGLHNVTFHSSQRQDILNGIERFQEMFGHYPYIHANHSMCNDALYWWSDRLTGMNKSIYNFLTGFKYNNKSQGHIVNSDLFWGDICQEKIKYVRNFVFGEINTLKACPYMPYHDSKRSYVQSWFASSEGSNVDSFNEMISEKNQDKLEEEGGLCIMYTHLARGFYENGRLNKRFEYLMDRLSKKNGWFVPVSTILDHMVEANGVHQLTDHERAKLERKWLLHKIKTRGTS